MEVREIEQLDSTNGNEGLLVKLFIEGGIPQNYAISYAKKFVENHIDLNSIEERDLTDRRYKELGVKIVGHRIKIARLLRSISALDEPKSMVFLSAFTS